jgi:hypothetical protein
MNRGSVTISTSGHNAHDPSIPSRTTVPSGIIGSATLHNTTVPSSGSSNIQPLVTNAPFGSSGSPNMPLFKTYAPFGFISACPTFSQVHPATSPTSSPANPPASLPPDLPHQIYATPALHLDPNSEELRGKTLITLLLERYDYRTMYNWPSLVEQIYSYLPFILQSSLGINGTLITQNHPAAFLLTPVEFS